MSLLSTIAGWFGLSRVTGQHGGQQIGQPGVSAYDDVPVTGPDAAMQVSAVWACVDLLVSTIASLPLMVYRELGAGQRDIERDSLLWLLLHSSPNGWQTAQEFLEYMSLNRVLRGNAYARIQRSSTGEAQALWPLAADQTMPWVDSNGQLWYRYTKDGVARDYPATDILHWRGMGNDLIGMSPLDYMRASVNLAISTQNHTQRTARNGGKPAGVLTYEGVLKKEQRDALRTTFDDIVNGPAQNLMILEADLKYQQVSLTAQDMQLLETRRFSTEDIARFFGVPSVLINDTAKTTTWGTGVEQIIEGFYKFKIRPELIRIEQAIERRVLTPAQRARYKVEFNFDALLRANLAARFEAYAKGTQNGIVTSNECRQLENLPPMPGGDTLRAQTNLAPLDMLGKIQGAANAGPQTPQT